MTPTRRAGANAVAQMAAAAAQQAVRSPSLCRIVITPRPAFRKQAYTTTPRRLAQIPSNTASSPASSTAATSASRPSGLAAENVDRVQHDLSPAADSTPIRNIAAEGLDDPLPAAGQTVVPLGEGSSQGIVDWTRSFHGLSSVPFTPEQSEILQEPLDAEDIEVKPDGIVYLPEIKYRRILNRAFRPGGWGLAPRGETIVTGKVVTREYGLVCDGRLVSVARGEQTYFDPDGIPTATEGCKSNALMRCCKDLGIASELWDPRFIRKFLREHARETIVEHQTTKKRRKHWLRKDDEVRWPLKEVAPAPAPAATAAAPAAAAKPAAKSTYTAKTGTTAAKK